MVDLEKVRYPIGHTHRQTQITNTVVALRHYILGTGSLAQAGNLG